MSLCSVFQSQMNHFDTIFAEHIRRMNAEVDLMRRRMFQLVPPEHLLVPVFTGREGQEHELEPQLPIVEENGEKILKMQFNVKDYQPDEIKVKVLENNVLQVCLLTVALSATLNFKHFDSRTPAPKNRMNNGRCAVLIERVQDFGDRERKHSFL